MNLTAPELRKIFPAAGSLVEVYLAPLNNAAVEFGILGERRLEHFLTQIGVESNDLTAVSENLNYTPEAILATFNNSKITRFTREQAQQYGRTKAHRANQEMIANIAYANRMGNKGPESGMGWLHRGSGFIQLTGYDNQKACAHAFCIPVSQIGEWLRTPEGAARSAAWYWAMRGCNELADADKFDTICDVVNIGRPTAKVGDAIGYKHRLDKLRIARGVIC